MSREKEPLVLINSRGVERSILLHVNERVER